MEPSGSPEIWSWLWDKLWLFILAIFGGFLKITADRHFQSMDDMSDAVERLANKLDTTNDRLSTLSDRVTRAEEWQKHFFHEGK